MTIYKGPNDLTGRQFSNLKVLKYLGKSKWQCLCFCGNKTIVKTANLTTGKTKSCGCLRGMNTKNNTRNKAPKEDLTIKKFGYLQPIQYIKGGKWLCKCDCGKETIVDTRNLKSLHTTSCGCLKSKNGKNITYDMNNYENEYIKVIEQADSTKSGMARWKCLCKNCGNIFITSGVSIRKGDTKSCGCVHSYNEIHITKILLENNIPFKTQYTFKDLIGKNNRPLRFDFAIFDENGELSHLIEYNGKQHYEKVSGKWGESFEDGQKRDLQKIEYCKKKNIELRIIPYYQEYTLKDLI